MRYKCHINVEVYNSITTMKSFYKYVYKGQDYALVVVQPEAKALSTSASQAATGATNGNNVPAARDEVQNYLDGWYVSASEACHQVFAFDLHGMHPNVYPKSEYATTLARNNNDPAPPLPVALTTLYADYLEVAVWSKSKKVWHLRKRAVGRRGASRSNHVTLGTVGRMYFVQPLEGERYYLRVLLTQVVGATCLEDLRTTHRPHTPTTIVHPTFKAACLARGLLQDDAESDQCLSEAVGVQLPRSLRQLFASLLIFNNVTNLRRLWNRHKGALAEDFLHQAR
jgi:hypothetical protein